MAVILETITQSVSSILWLCSQPVYLIITVFETNFEAISAIVSTIFSCLYYIGKALQLLMYGAFAMFESVITGLDYLQDFFHYIWLGLQHLIRFSLQIWSSICLAVWNFGPVAAVKMWHGVAWCFSSFTAGVGTVFEATTAVFLTPHTLLEYLKSSCTFLSKALGVAWTILLNLAQILVNVVTGVLSVPMTLVTAFSDLFMRCADNLRWIEYTIIDARDFLYRKADEMYDDIAQIQDKVSTSILKLISAVFYVPFYIFVLALVCILVVVIPMKFYTLYRNAIILANSLVGLLHGALFRSEHNSGSRYGHGPSQTADEEDSGSDEDTNDLLPTNLQPRRIAPAPPRPRATAPPEHIFHLPPPPSANRPSHSEHRPGSSGEHRLQIPRRAPPSPPTSGSKQPSSGQTADRLARQLEEERDRQLCVVCQDNVKNILIFPCKHLCVCVTCVEEITNQPRRTARSCPLCRGSIKSYLEVYS